MPNLFTKVKDRARAAAQPKPRTTHQVRGQVDTPFLLLTVLLVVVGLVMLLSASYPTAYYDIKHVTGGDAFYYFKRQALFAVLGLVVMYLVSKVNYQGLRGLAVLVLVLACLCMLAVKLPGLGVTAGGATRWLKYPIQWQPSELGKFGLVLYVSSRLSQRDHRTPLGFRRNHALGRFGNLLERIGFFELIPYAFVIGIMVGILAIQHHMSATIQMVVIAAAVLTVLPELLRSMNDYRMLIYAIVLIVVMIFNQSPEMIALRKRLTARFRKEDAEGKGAKDKEKKGVA